MGSRFQQGQTVRALCSAQGFEAGELLRVAAVEVLATAFGGFTTLSLERASGELLSVANGHLLLEVCS